MTFLAASHIEKKGTFCAGQLCVEFPDVQGSILSVAANHSSLGLRNKVLAQAGYLIVANKERAASAKRQRQHHL
jgi:hypothetical protein